jgi:hypothetical protein
VVSMVEAPGQLSPAGMPGRISKAAPDHGRINRV